MFTEFTNVCKFVTVAVCALSLLMFVLSVHFINTYPKLSAVVAAVVTASVLLPKV